MAKADSNKMRGASLDAKVAFWRDEIDTFERMFDKFLRRGRKVQKKYKDIRSPREEATTRYNILWANVQTRLPALYARNPKVVVERRFKDKDPVGRMGAEILERSIQYTLDHCNDAWETNRQVVLDYELPGRGIVWIRYEPHFKKPELDAALEEKRPKGGDESGEQDPSTNSGGNESGPAETAQPLTADAEQRPAHSSDVELAAQGPAVTTEADDEVEEETLEYEETKVDYVYWEDYGHSWARFDSEIRGKWRRVYMDREELEERFGGRGGLSKEEIAQIPLDWAPKNTNDAKVPLTRKKAIVYEIWDRRRRRVLWLVKNYPKLLDERDDMLGLKDFFPCPRPLTANLCNDDLLPTPNFTFYQDQANEIDELSTRIMSITKALKVAGVRDTSAEGLDRLLAEGVENQLVPVDGWAALKEKGGLAGVFELLPMDMIANTLEKLREQRKELIEDVYQLTGISDIVRGMSDPNETATAQQLKGQFSMIRVEDAQTEVQRFCRDQIVIIGQIVAGYSIETLKAISGVKLLTKEEKLELQMQLAALQRQQQMQQMAQSAPPPQSSPAQAAPAGPPGMRPGVPGAAPNPTGAGAGAQAPAPPPGPPQAMPQPGGGMHPMAPSMPQTPAVGQAPPSPEKLQMLELPTWEEVGALLENPVLREFRLEIETDSTIRMDEEAEKKARIELIATVSDFLQKMVESGMQAPEILPMLGELLMFGIRAFKTARSVEQTFDDMMQALEKMAKQPKPPDPKIQEIQVKAQTELQIAQGKAELDKQIAIAQQQAQAQQDAQQQQLEAQRDQQKATLDAQLEQHKASIQAHTDTVIQDLKNRFEAERVQWETEAKERIADLQAKTQIEVERMRQEHEKSLKKADHAHEEKIVRMTPKPRAAGESGGK